MKRSRFSEEQIVYAIRQTESGTSIGALCRQLGVSEATFDTWKKKYAHLGASELRRELAHWFQDTFSVSCVSACRLAQCGRASWDPASRTKDQSALRLRIRDLPMPDRGSAISGSGCGGGRAGRSIASAYGGSIASMTCNSVCGCGVGPDWTTGAVEYGFRA